jgi:pimeloyl-ACP methyl ester carboxylesterase
VPELRLDGTRLHYEARGSGPPLLFLHGLGSSGRDWERQVDAFADRYRVVAPDLRGHGRSDKPPGPYSLPGFAADCAALLAALEASPAHVVGVSMGGMVAFQLALDAPERVRSLTVVNSAPELVIRTVRDRLKLWQRRLIVRLLGMRRLGEILAGRLFPEPGQAELRRVFAGRWAENDPRAYRASLAAMLGWSVTDRLGELTCPTLVVAAEHDYTPVAAKLAYVARLPQARLVVMADARHAVPMERPEAFNRVLGEFLDGLP